MPPAILTPKSQNVSQHAEHAEETLPSSLKLELLPPASAVLPQGKTALSSFHHKATGALQELSSAFIAAPRLKIRAKSGHNLLGLCCSGEGRNGPCRSCAAWLACTGKGTGVPSGLDSEGAWLKMLVYNSR